MRVRRFCRRLPRARRVVSAEALFWQELIAEEEPGRGDLELADTGVVRAAACLEDRDGAFDSESPRRNWRSTTLSERWEMPYSDRRVTPNSSATSWVIMTLTLAAGAALQQRVDVLAEPQLVSADCPQVAEAVDDDPLAPVRSIRSRRS